MQTRCTINTVKETQASIRRWIKDWDREEETETPHPIICLDCRQHFDCYYHEVASGPAGACPSCQSNHVALNLAGHVHYHDDAAIDEQEARWLDD